MFEKIATGIGSVFASIPFSGATWFVIAIIGFFIWLFARGSTDTTSPVKWEHLVIDSSNDRASPYKVGYLIGLIVGTWVIVSFSDRDKLTYDIFGMYLTYLLGGASWNAFMKAKETNMTKTSYESMSNMSARTTNTVTVRADGKLEDE